MASWQLILGHLPPEIHPEDPQAIITGRTDGSNPDPFVAQHFTNCVFCFKGVHAPEGFLQVFGKPHLRRFSMAAQLNDLVDGSADVQSATFFQILGFLS